MRVAFVDAADADVADAADDVVADADAADVVADAAWEAAAAGAETEADAEEDDERRAEMPDRTAVMARLTPAPAWTPRVKTWVVSMVLDRRWSSA